MKSIATNDDDSNILQHYGVMGMKWGVRNADTKARYDKKNARKEKKLDKYRKYLDFGTGYTYSSNSGAVSRVGRKQSIKKLAKHDPEFNKALSDYKKARKNSKEYDKAINNLGKAVLKGTLSKYKEDFGRSFSIGSDIATNVDFYDAVKKSSRGKKIIQTYKDINLYELGNNARDGKGPINPNAFGYGRHLNKDKRVTRYLQSI